MSEPRISVVIPVVNNANKIGKCLESVLNQSIRPYGVIVVDGHSTDGTIDVVKGFPAKLVFEDYHTRAGALQVGIDNSTGDLIAFTDSDCIADNHWLKYLTQELVDGVAGVGGRFEDIGASLWTRSLNLTFKTPFSGARSRWADRRVMKNLSVCGANGMCRKEDILKAGGFDPAFEAAEDLEFGKRLGKLGKLVYTPNAVVYHDHSRGLLAFAKLAYRYGRHRRESQLWDTQALFALVSPILLLSGIIALYLAVIIALGITTAISQKNPVYVFSTPVSFFVQHSLFIIGFWKQTLFPRKGKK
jgi:glycosyltransferase involved in cell wall biosynthesis